MTDTDVAERIGWRRQLDDLATERESLRVRVAYVDREMLRIAALLNASEASCRGR